MASRHKVRDDQISSQLMRAWQDQLNDLDADPFDDFTWEPPNTNVQQDLDDG